MKTFLTGIVITSILYIIIYLIYTFIVWNFTNPFLWIISIPKYDQGTRVVILFYWSLYYIILYISIYNYYKNKQKDKQL